VLPKAERQEIGELIRGVCECFGNVHAHRGLGVRGLGHGFYECRNGLKQWLIFEYSQGVLYFHTLGDHEHVRRFLRRHR
jgi:hypothetical protein